MSSCGVDSVAALSLADMLETNTTLRKLALVGNDIEENKLTGLKTLLTLNRSQSARSSSADGLKTPVNDQDDKSADEKIAEEKIVAGDKIAENNLTDDEIERARSISVEFGATVDTVLSNPTQTPQPRLTVSGIDIAAAGDTERDGIPPSVHLVHSRKHHGDSAHSDTSTPPTTPQRPACPGYSGGLPAGWERCITDEGLVYYTDHVARTTHWSPPPRPSKDDELPPGWQTAVTNDGEEYYINHSLQTTTWARPTLSAVVVPATPLPVYTDVYELDESYMSSS